MIRTLKSSQYPAKIASDSDGIENGLCAAFILSYRVSANQTSGHKK